MQVCGLKSYPQTIRWASGSNEYPNSFTLYWLKEYNYDFLEELRDLK